jgi:hypothetical protein
MLKSGIESNKTLINIEEKQSLIYFTSEFFLSNILVTRNFTLKMDMWDDRNSNDNFLHMLYNIPIN